MTTGNTAAGRRGPRRELEAIDLRHLEVDEGDVESFGRLEPAERLDRRPGLARNHPPAGRLGDEDPSVRGVVVDDQDVPTAEVGLDPLRAHRDHRAGVGDRHPGRDAECRAFAGDALALGGERTVHELGEAAADRKPKTGPAIAPGDRRVYLAERLEQAVHRRGRDADPGVADVDPELPALPLVATPGGELLTTDGHDDLASFGELHRVRQEVEQDLTQPADVAEEGDRQLLVDRVDELEALACGGGSHDVERGLDRVAEDEGVRVELDATRLDLGEVEDVVDDGQEGVTGGSDRLGEVAPLTRRGRCRGAGRSSR